MIWLILRCGKSTIEIQAIWDENEQLSEKHTMSPEQAAAEKDRLLARMKERNPEAYERFMRVQAERAEEERRHAADQ